MDLIHSAIIDRMAKAIGQSGIQYKVARIVFVCGAADSFVRKTSIDRMREKRPGDVIGIMADNIWNNSNRSLFKNAMEMELIVGNICDCVLLFGESPSSFAELGAFSVIDEIRKKTYAPKDLKYVDSESFLNHGPYSWIDQRSDFHVSKHAVFECDYTDIVSIHSTVDAMILTMGDNKWRKIDNINSDDRAVFVMLIALVYVFAPIELADIVKYLGKVTSSKITKTVNTYAMLAVEMGLLSAGKDSKGKRFFSATSTLINDFQLEIKGLGKLDNWRIDILSKPLESAL